MEAVKDPVLLGAFWGAIEVVDVVEAFDVAELLLDEAFEVFGLPNKLLY